MEQSKEQQRTFAHVLFAARELTRLELVPEAVRALLEHLATVGRAADPGRVGDGPNGANSQGRQVRMCSQPSHPVAWLTAATPPAMAPYTVVRFGKRQCGPCPEKAECTTGEARTIDFRPRRIHEIQEPTDSDHRPRPPTAFGGHAEFPSDSSRTPPTDLALGR